MTALAAQAGAAGARRRLSAFLYRRRPLKLALLLAAPLSWILVVYLAALGVLLLTSLWVEDELSGRILHTFTLDNFRQLWDDPTYRSITRNTVQMAVLVTIADVAMAFPLAYYMVRLASPKMRALLFVGVLMPLWSSYLIKAYTWRLITAQNGPMNWAFAKVGLGPYHLAFTNTAMWLAFSYMWLPYMVLPVYAALERVPGSLLEASRPTGRAVMDHVSQGDLAARAARDRGRLDLHLLAHARRLRAADLVGGNNHEFIGNVIFAFQGVAQNLPFAAAFACVPVAIVVVYLMLMKRIGAFEAL